MISCTQYKEEELLTILMQPQLLGHSAGTSLNNQQTSHCKPIKGCQLISKE